MSSSLSVGLALAVPVRPDILGERLQAYFKVVPTLHTLRLCHRFGKGPHVHITKLPAEIELAIEKLIIVSSQRECYGGWKSAFLHYEGRCAPMDHLEDVYSPLSDQASDHAVLCASCLDQQHYYFCTEECETRCKPENINKCWTCSQTLDDSTCMRTCEAKIHHDMNTIALEDWEVELNDDSCNETWENKIGKEGFDRYEKVLRQHFGLEVMFSTSRIAREDKEHWPRHMNHEWHREEELKTTICYLTLSTQRAPRKTYMTSPLEDDVGGVIEATHAVVIKPTKVNGDAGARKRFHHAMNILRLEPYQHPSQRHTIVMPSGGTDEDAEVSLEEGSAAWPKLVMFATTVTGIVRGDA